MEERQNKKKQFQQSPRSRRPVMVALILLLIAGGIAAWALLPNGGGRGEAVRVVNGLVTIPAAPLANGQARFYRYAGDDGEIAFFVVKSRDGIIRAAFDSCDVCYKARKGYRQEGEFMVCNNCNQQFRTDLVNEVKGGCNPAPLKRELRGDHVVIRSADLEAGRGLFLAAGN
jgi:uncharacterized membrane protein